MYGNNEDGRRGMCASAAGSAFVMMIPREFFFLEKGKTSERERERVYG